MQANITTYCTSHFSKRRTGTCSGTYQHCYLPKIYPCTQLLSHPNCTNNSERYDNKRKQL